MGMTVSPIMVRLKMLDMYYLNRAWDQTCPTENAPSS